MNFYRSFNAILVMLYYVLIVAFLTFSATEKPYLNITQIYHAKSGYELYWCRTMLKDAKL